MCRRTAKKENRNDVEPPAYVEKQCAIGHGGYERFCPKHVIQYEFRMVCQNSKSLWTRQTYSRMEKEIKCNRKRMTRFKKKT